MKNKGFAEKHAGEYFLYGKVKVRVVGYYAEDTQMILVSVPTRAKGLGWSESVLNSNDVLVVKSKAQKYFYVLKESLRKWKIQK